MTRFLTGLALAALSGGGTWAGTHDTTLALIVAAVVAFAVWFGGVILVLILDN